MKLIRDTAYFAIIHWKKLHDYLVTRKGDILNVRLSDGFGMLL